MYIKFFAILFLTIVTLSHAAKLPKFLNKCKTGDGKINECILNQLKAVYKEFVNGDNATHLQSLNPLKVPEMHINIEGNLIINIYNATVTGFEDAIIEKIDFNTEKKYLEVIFEIPTQINLISDYDINGRILILPIQGKGPANITFVHPNITFKVEFDIKNKGNKEYVVPNKNEFLYTLERVHFELGHLFNGDERLGKEMLSFLNENWKEVNNEIGTKVAEAIGEVITMILRNFFERVPISEMIDGKI